MKGHYKEVIISPAPRGRPDNNLVTSPKSCDSRSQGPALLTNWVSEKFYGRNSGFTGLNSSYIPSKHKIFRSVKIQPTIVFFTSKSLLRLSLEG